MRTNQTRVNAWIMAGLVATAAGCGGREVNLGGTEAAESASGRAARGDDAGSASTGSYGGIPGAHACTNETPINVGNYMERSPDASAGADPDAGATLAPIVGTWSGYAENLQTGSGTMSLVFSRQADGSVSGSLTFGSGAQPPPPTQRTDVFPPGSGGVENQVQYPFPGFGYTAVGVSFDGERLQLGIVAHELWKPWCALQTSYDWGPADPGACGCLPDWSGEGSVTAAGSCTMTRPDTLEQVPVPCTLRAPCEAYPVCFCNAAGCSVNMEDPNSTLDVQLAGDRLDGSISGLSSAPLNVHLTRSP